MLTKIETIVLQCSCNREADFYTKDTLKLVFLTLKKSSILVEILLNSRNSNFLKINFSEKFVQSQNEAYLRNNLLDSQITGFVS